VNPPARNVHIAGHIHSSIVKINYGSHLFHSLIVQLAYKSF